MPPGSGGSACVGFRCTHLILLPRRCRISSLGRSCFVCIPAGVALGLPAFHLEILPRMVRFAVQEHLRCPKSQNSLSLREVGWVSITGLLRTSHTAYCKESKAVKPFNLTSDYLLAFFFRRCIYSIATNLLRPLGLNQVAQPLVFLHQRLSQSGGGASCEGGERCLLFLGKLMFPGVREPPVLIPGERRLCITEEQNPARNDLNK